MQNFELPVGPGIYREATYFLKNDLKDFFGYIDVLVLVKNADIPVLPYRCKKRNMDAGILYPVGVFRFVYFSEELKYAVSAGAEILQIFAGIEFDKKNLFKEHITELYAKRQNSSPEMAKLYKTLLNSLYGRFALVTEKLIMFDPSDETSDVRELNVDYTDPFIDAYVIKKNLNISLSAAISSYARIFMLQNINQYSLRVAYIDTDGLFTTEPLPDCLLSTSKTMGKFRLVSENTEAFFISGKFYFYKEKNSQDFTLTLRGIPKPFIMSAMDIIKSFKEALPNILPSSLSFPFSITTQDQKTNVYDFVFHLKRQIILIQEADEELKIITRPWRVLLS